MVEGYTVTEAASVLGVPSERVWELIARGVLAAEPEGKTGMRVFLQPRTPVPVQGGGRSGDNGDVERSGDAGPFRALLSEFRTLTERYGQALLALGEARGEVASLRSRVDLLEARIDLRLPSSAAEPPIAWSPPPAPAPEERRAAAVGAPEAEASVEPRPAKAAAEPTDVTAQPAEAPAEPAAQAENEPTMSGAPVVEEDAASAPDEAASTTRRRRRTLSNREAVAWFAEALARADDPSRPELLRSGEMAEALAALGGATTTSGEAAVEEELLVGASASAIEVPTAEEPEPQAKAAVELEPQVDVEPPVELEPAIGPEPQAAEVDAEPERGFELPDGKPAATTEAAEVVEATSPISPPLAPRVLDEGSAAYGERDDWVRPEPEPEAELERQLRSEPPLEPELQSQPEPSPAAIEATPPSAGEADLSAYTTQFDEPDWITEEDLDEGLEPEAPQQPEPLPTDHFAQGAALEPFDLDAISGGPEASGSGTATEPSDEYAAELEFATPGWHVAGESAPRRVQHDRPEEALPGQDLPPTDLAAKPDAAPRAAGPGWDPDEPEPDDEEPDVPRPEPSLPGAAALDDALAALGRPQTNRPSPDRRPPDAGSTPVRAPRPPAPPAFNWRPPADRQIEGPAARAYRRLRRIFPG